MLRRQLQIDIKAFNRSLVNKLIYYDIISLLCLSTG
jgi:hypothetical protein